MGGVLRNTTLFLILVVAAPALADDLICGSRQAVPYNGHGVQDFTIPTVDPPQFLRLIAEGADGGDAKAGTNDHCQSSGGRGAVATALFKVGFDDGQLAPGGKIRFIIGQAGETDFGNPAEASQGAGGGGSGILYLRPGGGFSDWKILIAGGAGGGAHQAVAVKVCVDSHDGDDGRKGECGSGYYGGCGGRDGNTRAKW